MVGLFINTLPLRIKTGGDETISRLLKNVESALKERAQYENTPLVDIKACTMVNDKYEIFDSIVIIENYPLDKALGEKKSSVRVDGYSMKEMTNYDLAVEIIIFDQLGVNIIYNRELFFAETIRRLSGHFVSILHDVVERPDAMIKDIDMLTPWEKETVLEDFNETETDYPAEKTIRQLFEEQVERTPEDVAVEFEGEGVTYRQLNGKANQLANSLRKKGLQADQIVGLMIKRSPEMLAGLMGILKAGGGYLPLVPDYPVQKLMFMLEDSDSEFLVTQQEFVEKLPFTGDLFIVDRTYPDENLPNPSSAGTPANLAYVIYTSGTTGTPKGVMLENRTVVNFFKGMTDIIDFTPGKTILAVTTISFDIFVLENLIPLTHGLKIIMTREEAQRNPELLSELIFKNNIDILQMTPSRMQLLLTEASSMLSLKLLEIIMIGGEAFPESLFRELSRKTPARIYNMYGPTETTVWSTVKELTGKNEIDIGKPIANTQIYILNRNMTPQPVGVPGELCIAGDGVARGYRKRPELTEEKFIANPFIPDTRMYRTGDLAKWLPDGNIEFIGRVDYQVKIRGFRVELGEIETGLLAHKDIKEAVVIDKEDENQQKYLGAYVVARKEIKPKEVREFLAGKLPEYMVPSYIIQVEKFPLTPSGKVNRKELPEPEDGLAASDTKYEEPRSDTEEKLVKIWKELFAIETIGINDNFFDLGGHSLKAISLSSRVSREFDVQLPVTEIFKTSTIKGLAKYIQDAEASIYLAIQPVKDGEYFPVSAAQKRMFALHQMETEGTGYNMSGLMTVEGHLDRLQFQETFEKLVRRHEAFRTSFDIMDGEPVQRIHQHLDFQVEFHEVAGLGDYVNPDHIGKIAKYAFVAEADADADCTSFLQGLAEYFIRPFDLSRAPLIRAGLFRLKDDKHILLVDMHHIISDGTSLGIIVRDFVHLFENVEMQPLRVQYKGYARWQQELVKKGSIARQEEYWKKQFADDIPILDMVNDFPRPAVQSFEGDSINFTLDPQLTDGLKEIADENRATLYMVLAALYNVLLSRYSNQEDIVVGSVIGGRPHIDLEEIVGVFVNTIAMRNFPVWESPFDEFLEDVKDRALQAYENQDFQFEDLVDKLNLKRDMSRNPLFDTMFTFEHLDIRQLAAANLLFKTYEIAVGIAKFDLSMTAVEREGQIWINLEYCTRLFKKETVLRMGGHFRNIVEAVVRIPETKISRLDMMTTDERHWLINEVNKTETPYANDKLLHQLVEDRAASTPEAEALAGVTYGLREEATEFGVPSPCTLTYAQLNCMANQMAARLREKGALPESIVGIITDRSVDMIVGLLAILKAGAAYCPILYNNPEERIRHILKDSGAQILLSHSHLKNKIQVPSPSHGAGSPSQEVDSSHADETPIHGLKTPPHTEIHRVFLDDASIYQGNEENPKPGAETENIAYVIYTSGSTGTPKGVLVEHENAVAYVAAFLNEFKLTEKDIFLQQASFAFDAFVEELYPILSVGGKVVMANDEVLRNIELLKKLIIERNVTVISCSPLLLNELNRFAPVGDKLRIVISGGDVLRGEYISNFLKQAAVYNTYGPTEATVCGTYHQCTAEDGVAVPIGKPIANYKVYVLDSNENPLPLGIPGELCIAGKGVARGYLKREELTNEKFVENPFDPGQRMYKTGDLARWMPGGRVEFLRRIDNQVNIRGFRIELGEIENRMLRHGDIKETAVVDREDDLGNKTLCAYIVTENDMELSPIDIRKYLADQLPEYMLPSFIVRMGRLPLNTSGKVDKKALPEPEGLIMRESEYVPPQDEIEEKMAEIWSDVLGIENVSVHENFFASGGDSIKAIQVAGRLQRYRLKMDVKDLFQNPTIRTLRPHVDYSRRKAFQGAVTGEIQLTPIQRWFLAQRKTGMSHWNQSVMLFKEEGFKEEALAPVLNKLIFHHDSLRMTFTDRDGTIIQSCRAMEDEGLLVDLKVLNLVKEENQEERVEEESQKLQACLNLEKGPLMSVGLFKTIKGDHLAFIIHHLAVDGVSWRILLEDFATLYQQQVAGKDLELQEKTDSFKDWASLVRNYSLNKELLKELEHWKTVGGAAAPNEGATDHVLSIPVDKRTTSDKVKDGATLYLRLDKTRTSQLLTETNHAYHTEINDLLLTALALAVKEWAGTDMDHLLIDLEGHGREQIVENIDISRTVGWFTSVFPVALEVAGHQDLSYRIKTIKETLRRVPNKGVGYGILKYLTPDDKKAEMNFDIHPEISFNYLGQADGQMQGSGGLSLSSLKTGEVLHPDSERDHLFDINGMIIDGCLELGFNYNRGRHKEETVQQLIDFCKSRLENIITHCAQKQETELTPSDLGHEDMSIDELEELQDDLEDLLDDDFEL
ncbi:MAG: amino acid adenylation domain-containing protein, partial [bacterium]|nr:amino acid adenylation domain-containing protein [bacterium]